jgi:hypothetical protein
MKAYERGEYPQSVALLEQALKDVGEYSIVGGEVQLWLALAYQVRGEAGAGARGAAARLLARSALRLAGDLAGAACLLQPPPLLRLPQRRLRCPAPCPCRRWAARRTASSCTSAWRPTTR